MQIACIYYSKLETNIIQIIIHFKNVLVTLRDLGN